MPRPPSSKARGQEANFRQLFRVYKRGAKRRKLPFSLTPENFKALTKSTCFTCGAKPKAVYRHSRVDPYYQHGYRFNGVDRLNNKKGYVDGNVATCCRNCNYAKGTLSLEQFLLFVYRIFDYAIAPALSKEQPRE